MTSNNELNEGFQKNKKILSDKQEMWKKSMNNYVKFLHNKLSLFYPHFNETILDNDLDGKHESVFAVSDIINLTNSVANNELKLTSSQIGEYGLCRIIAKQCKKVYPKQDFKCETRTAEVLYVDVTKEVLVVLHNNKL